MSVDLSNYVDVLRREVTPPGSTLFEDVDDLVFAGFLADSFWEARLDGFLKLYTCDVDGIVTPLDSGTVDITRDLIALISIYAGIKIIRNKLIATNTKFTAKAGVVEFSTENSANLLTEMAKQLSAVKDRLVALAAVDSNVTLIDGFGVRASDPWSYAGYLYSWYDYAVGY